MLIGNFPLLLSTNLNTKIKLKLLTIKVMKHFKIIFILVALVSFTTADAQSYFSKFKSPKKWSVGLQISPTLLNGDADNGQVGFSSGAHVKYSVSPSFGLKASGNIGTLKGGRTDYKFSTNGNSTSNTTLGNQNPTEDSYTVKNNFKDLDLVGVFTLGNISFFKPLRSIQLFTFFGVGAVWSDAQGSFADAADAQGYYTAWPNSFIGYDVDGSETTDASQVVDARSSYKGRNFTVPFGLGFKRNFGDRLDLGLEWKTRWTRTDALDAFSFPVPTNRFTDFYSTLGLQASFKLGKESDEGHYDWINPVATVYDGMDSLIKITDKLMTLADDADGDGVGDFFDTDNNTEKGAKVYGDGTMVDTDGDGVPDHKDLEPFSIKDPNVKYDENGRAIDSDGDGVPDGLDVEPNSAPGSLVAPDGSAIQVGGACCNCENVTLPTIIFDNNSSKIPASSYGVLYTIAEKMKQCPELTISATGYTVNKSGEQLAWKRSNAIIDHLEANYGIERSRLSTGYATGSGVEYSTRRIDLSQSSK